MFLEDRKFCEHLEADGATLSRAYYCPCCGYPTLTAPADYQICVLCSWEDDGGDGYGPNGSSLEEAQGYFQHYLTSYSPTHKFSPQFQTPDRQFVHQDVCSPSSLDSKNGMMTGFEQYMAEPDLKRRGQLWRRLLGV